jgi:hypothetical protein
MAEANILLKAETEKLDKLLEPINNPKKQSATFRNKLIAYNRPLQNIIIGTLF